MFILTFVFIIIILIIKSKFINMKLLEVQIVEWVWTTTPAIFLLQIALPRLILLYILDEAADIWSTIKAIGHQWYWRYEYRDFSFSLGLSTSFDSYIIQTNELEADIFRLLEVDNRILIPLGEQVRVIITSIDVLHSWTVPSMGVKADAVPGRLNQVKFLSYRPGVFYGQCSEICGSNHRFIPIVVEIVLPIVLYNWIVRCAD